MPELNVRYVGLIRRLVKASEETVSLPAGATLRDLLAVLAARHDLDLEESLIDGERLGPLVTVLVDGVNCVGQGELGASLDGLGQVEIVLMGPPAMGGSQ